MRRWSAFAVALILLLVENCASAYCRSAVCSRRADGSTEGHVCTPAQSDDCGSPLQWRQPCISFAIAKQASNPIDEATAEAMLTQAFAAWTRVDCQPGMPSIQVFDEGTVTCSKLEYNRHAGNANVLIFRDDAWPHPLDNGLGTVDTLALTTVTYDVDKGDIYDADIEVNSAYHRFTTTDTPGLEDVDLLSVLTHEAGHFLGIAHSAALSTMFPNYDKGTIGIRTLAEDDRAAICAAYPVGRTAIGACTGIPRHGFAPECLEDQTYVRCGVVAGKGGDMGGEGALMTLGLVAAMARARRGAQRW